MASEKSVEIQVKTVEKGMETIVKLIKENQKRLEDLLRANSEVIKKIDNVMSSIEDENANADLNKVEETYKRN